LIAVLTAAPISYVQAVILGLIQGVAELFPISSLGQSVVLPHLFGWNIHQNDAYFLSFLVATHLATALVLLGFFWADWVRIIRGLARSVGDRAIAEDNPDGRLGWLLIAGTIPAGVLGLALQNPLRDLFASPQSAAFFLILNGALLYVAERLRRRAPVAQPEDGVATDARVADTVGWGSALAIGAAQALALIPGFSRSGASMAGGLRVGLSNEDAARFAFLLATPVIGAAAVLKLPDLFGSAGNGVRGQALVASLCAAVAAYFSVRYLMRYFETSRLTPFAVFCAVEGVILSVYFAR
jgi:undecaprenyl-diphosphatase